MVSSRFHCRPVHESTATLAQHFPLFGGLAGGGVSAYYYKQVTADSGDGATLGDFKGKTVGLGPVVSFVTKILDRWGVGPVMLFPTATNDALGADQWAIGPAAGFVARSQKLLWGVFNQNLFSYAGNNDRETSTSALSSRS